ncbi:hypothetical protein ScPMuIL_018524 [Solemya velum]
MDDEDENARDSPSRHQLLIGLKKTVQGLLASHSTNVWSTYGGLTRACHHVQQILQHGFRTSVGFDDETDFWPFVQGLKWLSPVLSPSIERVNRMSQTLEADSKSRTWVQESLVEHNLSMQLRILVANKQHLQKHYHENALLCCPDYFKAVCICLQAVEQNKVALLADLDPSLLSGRRRASAVSNKTSETQPIKMRHRRSSQGEMLSIPPPFASPKRESPLSTCEDHAVPSDMVVSVSPEDTRNSAKSALKTVLKMSGSESPIDAQQDFNFYDSVHNDPLLNIEFQSGKTPKETKDRKASTSSSGSQRTSSIKSSEKDLLRRSQSSGQISGQPASNSESRTAQVLDSIFNDEEEIPSDNDKNKDSKALEISVGPESYSVRDDSIKNESLSKKGHKRSRSDVVFSVSTRNLKNSGQDSIDGQSTMPRTKQMDSTFHRNMSENIINDQNSFQHESLPSPRDSYFPRPVQGQSLIHYLSSQDFNTCANIDKENAHFSISEALIAAIEQMKWNHIISPPEKGYDQEECESDEEIQQLKQRIRLRRRERLKEKARGFPAFSDGKTDTATSSQSTSLSLHSSSEDSLALYTDSSDSSEDIDDQGIELTMTEGDENKSSLALIKSSGLSLSMASLYSDADIQKSNISAERHSSGADNGSSYLSAESVAISLLKKFSEKQLPKASDLDWLVSEQDAPQALLPLPTSKPISPDDGEHADMFRSTAQTRIRGNLEWAPPRAQIIFSIHPVPKRKIVLAKQNNRCAGCGMKVEPGYVKRFRYCEYLGKFFCQCCHSNSTMLIPGRILRKWDFRKFAVSNFARDLLVKIHSEPLFNIVDINPTLYRRVRQMESLREYRSQLIHLKTFLRICKHSGSLLKEVDKLPHHWVNEVHLYSLNDLEMIRSGQILNQVKNLVSTAINHVDDCAFCQGLGFICELCRDQRDVIFPFQLQTVTQCPDCHSCYHKSCFIPEKCPKCARIEARKIRLAEEKEKGELEEFDDG